MQNITVATVTDDFLSPLPGSSFRQDARAFPSFTIAPNDTLYVAWGNHANGHAVVMVTKSTNDGLTWSTPVVAGDVRGRSGLFSSAGAGGGQKMKVGLFSMDDGPTGAGPPPRGVP